MIIPLHRHAGLAQETWHESSLLEATWKHTLIMSDWGKVLGKMCRFKFCKLSLKWTYETRLTSPKRLQNIYRTVPHRRACLQASWLELQLNESLNSMNLTDIFTAADKHCIRAGFDLSGQVVWKGSKLSICPKSNSFHCTSICHRPKSLHHCCRFLITVVHVTVCSAMSEVFSPLLSFSELSLS